MRAAAFRAPLRARGMPSHRRSGVSAAAPADHGLIMPREPLRLREGDPLWVFGYGSIVWKVGFAYTERKICCARGWRRRFYQGSTDHRGTTAFPGRTVTLERCDPVEDPPCWGAAYRVAPEDVEATLANLEVREKQYDLRAQFDLHASADADAPVVVRDAVTWLATSDPANLNWLGEPEGVWRRWRRRSRTRWGRAGGTPSISTNSRRRCAGSAWRTTTCTSSRRG